MLIFGGVKLIILSSIPQRMFDKCKSILLAFWSWMNWDAFSSFLLCAAPSCHPYLSLKTLPFFFFFPGFVQCLLWFIRVGSVNSQLCHLFKLLNMCLGHYYRGSTKDFFWSTQVHDFPHSTNDFNLSQAPQKIQRL